MSADRKVFIGTDGGATTSKVGGVWDDGTTVSIKVLQASTNAQLGPDAVVREWADAVTRYLEQNGLTWKQVQGVGLSIPGPYQRYGVFDRSANLPESFTGFDVYTAYIKELSQCRPARALGGWQRRQSGRCCRSSARGAVKLPAAWSCSPPAPDWGVPTSIPAACLSMAIPSPAWKPATWPPPCKS